MFTNRIPRIFVFAVLPLALLAIFALTPRPAYADGLVIVDCPPLPEAQIEPGPSFPCLFGLPCRPPVPPRPRTDCASYLSVKNHNVTTSIDNQVAQTKIDQTFVNPSDYQLEGTYIFPLPDDATLDDFAMYVDGKRLEGKVLDRDQARRIYEDIVRSRRDPALLQYIGRNAFQARIFPIEPHGTKRVEISYRQVLKAESGLIRYVYPLSTEKFSNEPLASVSINVSIKSSRAVKAIYSSSHDVAISRKDDYNATVGYEASNVKPDRDFIVYYSLSDAQLGATLFSYKPDSQADGFFLLLVAPPVQVQAEKIVAKDVILVLDTSGSMQGEKIAQAKNALNYVLGQLNAQDRFNIVAFSTGIVSFANSPQPLTQKGEAERFVDRIAASGSTDLNRALLEALSTADKERPTIVVLLTDGLPTAGEVNTERILVNVNRAAGSNVRLFSFGVGDDVNTLLLDSLSEKQRGATGYVRPGEKIDETVSEFYNKVSTPVLSDIAIDWGSTRVDDLYPYPLPDLFAGSQLVLAGRYRDGGPQNVSIKGNVNGQAQVFRFEDLSLKTGGGEPFVAPLWATRKIGYLLSQIRLDGENQEAVDEIVALAVRYGIVTPYTSFLIDEGQDVFTPEGRGGAAQDMGKMLAPAAAPTMGPTAVAQSQVNRAMKEANTAANESSQVKQIADKAFILKDGVWTDTTYDPTRLNPIKVGFASETYFNLLSLHPDWAEFIALGDHVIFVVDNVAYEIS
ncbi:MAG: VIT domain-containing protein [Rudaea sp.]